MSMRTVFTLQKVTFSNGLPYDTCIKMPDTQIIYLISYNQNSSRIYKVKKIRIKCDSQRKSLVELPFYLE